MYVEKKVRETEQFNLQDATDLERLRTLKNDPRIVILTEKAMVLKNTEFDGEVTRSQEEVNLFVEYETCSL